MNYSDGGVRAAGLVYKPTTAGMVVISSYYTTTLELDRTERVGPSWRATRLGR